MACWCTGPNVITTRSTAVADPFLSEETAILLKDAWVVAFEIAADQVKTKRRGPPLSTHAPGQMSYPTRPRRR